MERGDEQLRAAATEPLGAEQVRVALLAPAVDEGFFGSRPNIAIGLVVFFAVALLAVALILRSLQGYVREMLGAARRIGEGDFYAAGAGQRAATRWPGWRASSTR